MESHETKIKLRNRETTKIKQKTERLEQAKDKTRVSLDNRENRLRKSSIQIEKARVQFSNSVTFKSTRHMLNGSNSLANSSVIKFDGDKT